MNLHGFYTGGAFNAYEYFGAHPEDGGVVFRAYAPRAERVSVMGEFSGWKELPMEPLGQSGVWIGFAKDAGAGQMYKYCVTGANGTQHHCDPYGFGMELRPGACSVIRDLRAYAFTDAAWMARRTRCFDGPLNIYELHLGSWKRNGGKWLSYEEIAEPLIAYLREHHYNYVEFMPLSEHPFDGSWGYQNTGFYAPTARYGTATQLMALVDRLHGAGIGAILDFVPVHFAVDGYGLRLFDGTALYEYPHRDVAESEWGSINFNHSRGEVVSFLQSAANYWLKEYHFDGLRVDAVSRLLYWQGDEKRGENGMAVNACYEREPALWARDAACDGFRWAESVSDDPCVFGYTRTDGESVDLILLNFSDREAALSLGGEDAYTVLLSTSWEEFGGREKKADAPPKALSPYGGLLLRRTKSSPSVK